MIKIFESDQKRLKGVLITLEEKKQDLNPNEIQQRNEVIEILKESMKLLRLEMEEQTHRVENGGYTTNDRINIIKAKFRNDASPDNDVTMDEGNSGLYSHTEDRITDDTSGLNAQQEKTFDGGLIMCQKILEKLEKQWLMEDGDVEEAVQWRLGENMTHSYFLDTVESWRPTF